MEYPYFTIMFLLFIALSLTVIFVFYYVINSVDSNVFEMTPKS